MFIRMVSDLHLEHDNIVNIPKLPEDTETVLVLAGDIGAVKDIIWLVDQLAPHFLGIVYISGNHEYYDRAQTVEDINFELENYFADLKYKGYTNCYFLNNSMCTIEGQVFIGSTLWSDFTAEAAAGTIPYHWLSDFRIINYYDANGERKVLNPQITAKWYTESVKYIKDTIYKYPDAVVVTHFSPSRKSITERFKGDALNSYFHNELDYILEQYNILWIHGHTHDSLDYKLAGSRVICNPKGYHDENSEFFNEKRIEINRC